MFHNKLQQCAKFLNRSSLNFAGIFLLNTDQDKNYSTPKKIQFFTLQLFHNNSFGLF